jgi:hypothetical protein
MLTRRNFRSQFGFTGIMLVAVLWLQVNVLWHDTAHAGHHHGPDLMCTLDVLIPDIGTDEHWPPGICTRTSAPVTSPLKAACSGGGALLAYLSRAPPQSIRCINR